MPGPMFDDYDQWLDAYKTHMAKYEGLAFPGLAPGYADVPQLSPRGAIRHQIQQTTGNRTERNTDGSLTGGPSSIRNFDTYQNAARAGASAAPRANPYQAGIADQTRQAQLALMGQIQAQRNGPSIAGMQGQRAMGQMGQAALGSGNARAAMLGTQGAATGIAGDTGQGRLGEIMRSQATFGGAASNLRGGDLRSAEAQSQAGMRMRGLDDASKRFYTSQGASLQNAQDRAYAEWLKIIKGTEANEAAKKAAKTKEALDILSAIPISI